LKASYAKSHGTVLDPPRSRRPRWNAADSDAFTAKYDAQRAAGGAWLDNFSLPTGRKLTKTQARNRRGQVKSSHAKRRRVVESNSDSDAAPPPAKRTQRFTPTQERAAAPGVHYVPTPPELREIFDDPSAPPAAKSAARKAIAKHHCARYYQVRIAETK